MEGTILCSSLSSLSTVASLATVTIILRSYDGLTSVYHRFFFYISISNVLFSLSMALNTLPMPKDMPYTQFEGLHIGNQTTCNIQGLLFLSGIAADFCYFAGLCLYYLCSITFKMKDKAFRKYIEPLIHALTGFVCVSVFVISLMSKMINPSIRRNWCARDVLPFWCDGKENESYNKNYVVCIRGDTGLEHSIAERLNAFSAIVATIVFMSMILIMISVYRSERSMLSEPSGNSPRIGPNATKVILVQISAYLLSIILFSIHSHLSLFNREISSLSTQYFYIIVGSTRGILNFCIFVGHKVYNLRRVHESFSLKAMIWKVLYSRNESVFVFDNVPSSLQLPGTPDPSNGERSHKSDKDCSESFYSDPTKPAHQITMFHLNQDSDDNKSLPSKEHNSSSINDDDLPSKHDMSSSIGFSLSDRESLDMSSHMFGRARR
jgi:hypothetical protein